MIIPPPAQEAVLKELQESHPGIVKMKLLYRSYVWWPGICEKLEATVKASRTFVPL